MKRYLQFALATLVLSFIATSSLSAQDDANAKIVGTWLLNIDKTAELMDDEAAVEQMKTMMAQRPMRMIFNEDASMDMKQGEQSMPAELSFELTAQEGSKSVYDISITGGPRPMEGEVEFMEDGSLRVQPEGQPPVILDREVEVVTLEKAKEFFTGKWTVNKEASTKLAAEGDEEAPESYPDLSIEFTADKVTLGEGDRDPMVSGYEIKAGEEENTFIVTLTPEDDGVQIMLKVAGKDRVHGTPKGEKTTAVFDRVKN